MIKLSTNKLFYQKYLYKISCHIPGAYCLRYAFDKNNNFTKKFLENHKRYHYNVNLSEIQKFARISNYVIENKDIKRRIERGTVDFYVINETDYNELKNTLKEYIKNVWEPIDHTESQILLDNKKYIFCNKLPHNKFKYKVIFKMLKPLTMSNIVKWAEKYQENEIFIKKSTFLHFKGIKHKHTQHYFYVDNEKTLFLLKIAASDAIQRIEEFISRKSLQVA